MREREFSSRVIDLNEVVQAACQYPSIFPKFGAHVHASRKVSLLSIVFLDLWYCIALGELSV